MVFSPDADSDVMLGASSSAPHHYDDDELIGGGSSDSEKKPDVINEGLDSLDDLLSNVVRRDGLIGGDED